VVEHLDANPTIEVRSRRKSGRTAHFGGMMTCGHIWTCPVCSQNLKAKRAEKLGAALRGMGSIWQMVTITPRHREGMGLQWLWRGLAAAWRRTRQGGRIQRIWGERVTASARAFEVTFGDNGPHPHIHVLLRTTEWLPEEKDDLFERFQNAIRKELGDECVPNYEHGIVWSEPFDASDAKGREHYLAKLGLELTGLAKEGRNGNRSPWQVALDASYGDEKSMRLWAEYCHASRGRRMLELDDRAAAAAEKQIEAERVDPLEDPEVHTLSIELKRDDVWALKRLEQRGMPTIFATVLSLAEKPVGAREAVEEFLSYAREHARTTTQDRWRFGRHGHGSAAAAHCDTS
jgi:hypothetical protein